MKASKGQTGALIVLVTALALAPYRRSFQQIFWAEGGLVSTKACDYGVVPELQLRPVRACQEMTMPIREPCVDRHVVEEAQLEAFLESNGHERLAVRNTRMAESDEDGIIGHPLLEGFWKGKLEAQRGNGSGTEWSFCTLGEIASGDPKCEETYSGFRSLNYSAYRPLKNDAFDINIFQRTDIFAGHQSYDKLTASFHSNSFEESTTLQIKGEKIWLMMSPESFFSDFGSYNIGPYNAAYNTCPADLSKVELQTVRTQPGDVLRFPRAWPHNIYTRKGPNVMINFRRFLFRPDSVKFFVALLSLFLNAGGHFDRTNCGEDTQPSNFGMGHPKPHFLHQRLADEDLRCSLMLNSGVVDYKMKAAGLAEQNQHLDQGIYRQITDFLHL